MAKLNPRFRFRLLIAAALPFLAVSGGLAANFLSGSYDLRPFSKWLWLALGGILIATIILSIIEALNSWKEELDRQAGSLRPPISTSLHQLPTVPPDFTGRTTELAELITGPQRGGLIISALQGLAGVGKTTLALKLAERLIPHYPDAQIYLDLKGNSKEPLSAADAMTHVTRSIYPTIDPPKTDAELAGNYRSALHGRQVLLLMDNASSKEQVEPLIPPNGCMMLVTSRRHFTLPGMLAKNIDALPPKDSRDLLLKIAPRIGSSADRMAELCGHLPLALRVAGSALIDRPDLAPADCINMLEDAEQLFKILDKVEASLRLSFDLLDPKLQKLWSSLSVFETAFEARSASSVWELESSAVNDVLGELIKYSLIDWNESTHRYKLHDLARSFADKTMTESERHTVKRRHAAFYLQVLEEARDLYREGGEENTTRAVATFDLDWNNIEAGQRWSESQMGTDPDSLRLCNQYADVGGTMISLHRHTTEQIAWFEAGLTAARQLNDRASEGHHLVNVGRSYYVLDGNPERAVNAYEQGLAIAREIGDIQGEGQALGNLGVVYRESGKSNRAIELFEQRLQIARQTNDKRGEANTLGNLGRTYWTIGNPDNLKRAIEICCQQLAIAREIGDRGNEARALGNLGQSYRVLAEYDRALELSQQSLAIQKQLGNRRAQGGALGDLGKTYEAMGQLERALKCYEDSLAIQHEIGYRRAQGYALGNIGRVQKRLGNMELALQSHEQHFAIAKETNDAVAEGMALFNICFVYRARNDYANAIAFAQKALKVFEQIEDPNANKVRKQLNSWKERVRQREEIKDPTDETHEATT